MGEENESVDQFFEVTDLPQPDGEAYWNEIVIPEKHRRWLLNYANRLVDMDEDALQASGIYKTVRFQGPPGTGKTTLALGYANEIARRCQK